MRKMLSNSILDLGKCPNRKLCTFTFMRFLVGAFPKVQNRIWKHFPHKVLYNYNSKLFLERFCLYLTKSKNGFPIVFPNLARKGSTVFFQARKLIFLPAVGVPDVWILPSPPIVIPYHNNIYGILGMNTLF